MGKNNQEDLAVTETKVQDWFLVLSQLVLELQLLTDITGNNNL